MFTIRNVVEQYTSKKAEVLEKSYSEVINTTCLSIIIYTKNGTRIFIDMHPEMKYTLKPEFDHERPNSRNVFRKFDFEIISGDNLVKTKGIDFKTRGINDQLTYALERPISEMKFNEFISDNGGIDTEKLTANINHLWNYKPMQMLQEFT